MGARTQKVFCLYVPKKKLAVAKHDLDNFILKSMNKFSEFSRMTPSY